MRQAAHSLLLMIGARWRRLTAVWSSLALADQRDPCWYRVQEIRREIQYASRARNMVVMRPVQRPHSC